MELGRDSFSFSHRRDVLDRRSPPPRVRRRSLSPLPKMDVSRRVELREGRLSSKGRRDYSWRLGAGKNEKVYAGSPPYHSERKSSYFDERVRHREHDYVEDIDYDDVKRNRLKQVYVYDHHGASSGISEERDRSGKRVLSIYAHERRGHKSAPVEVGMARGSYQMSPDLVPTSDYEHIGGHLRLPSRNTQINQLESENLQYRDSITSDKIPKRDTYENWEKPEFYMRDISYVKVPASHIKDLESAAQYRDLSRTSFRISSSEFPISYKEGLPLPTSDDAPRSSVKFMEPVQYTTYGQSSAIDMRTLESGKRIETDYSLGMCSPNRAENDYYIDPKIQGIINDDVYLSDEHRTRMLPPHSWVDYEQSEMDYERRELSRKNIMHPPLDNMDQNENSLRNMRKNSVWNHPTIQKQVDTEGFDSSRSRTLYTSKHHGDYLSSGYTQIEFARRETQENETTSSGFKADHQSSHLKPNYAFEREPSPQFQKERLQDPLCMYDFGMQGFAVRRPRMKEDMTYEPSDEVLKRNYLMDEDTGKQDVQTVTSRKWNLSEELGGFCDHEEWNNVDSSILRASRTQRFEGAYRKGKAKDDDENPAFQNLLSSQDYLRPALRNSVKHYKPSMKYIKGHPKSGSLRWHNLQQIDRNTIHRRRKIGKRVDDYFEDTHENDDVICEDMMNSIEPDSVEDSEEFKQKVDEACLIYSKKINLNSSVKRRYKEQGKAGGLFCIVCGSSSKEFMDTRRLVTHAFMSRKAGLRVQHLGLHKAICILMGWNSYIPLNVITWVPDVLSRAEALVQKENLILWPPVFIIHNISMSNNNPELQKVLPIEEVECFIRGKVVIGVKIKVCLGKPADQSVVLVKFLGTFTGLENAERLHRYFADHKHGREDFEQKASRGNRCSNSSEVVGLQEDKLVENLLYGYMGIAEDLDWLDFHSKKGILIKSKKEIMELANAPVRNGDK